MTTPPELRRDLSVTAYYRWELGGDKIHAPWVIEVHPMTAGESQVKVYSAGGLPADERARSFAEGLADHLGRTFLDAPPEGSQP